MRRRYKFHSFMLNGHPGGVTRGVRRVIVRGHNHQLSVTSTTDGQHAHDSYHYTKPLGMAVDLGNKPQGAWGAVPGTPKARRLMVKLQADLIKWFGCRSFLELFGPDNALNCKDGRQVTLDDGSPLENQHDTHVHVVPARLLPLPKMPGRLLKMLRAKRRGAKYVRSIFRSADSYNISYALALALFQHEANFLNQYGHDHLPGQLPIWHRNWGRVMVTKDNYAAYKAWRNTHHLAQGVGPGQLTSPGYQDMADARGGCWRPGVNIDLSLAILAGHIAALGVLKGVGAYNGGRGNPNLAYAQAVLAKRDVWKNILEGK